MAVSIEVFANPDELAQAFANTLLDRIDRYAKTGGSRPMNVCLSGGSTPKRLFQLLASKHADRDWAQVAFFWGDERCVPPDDPESNFGEANRLFFQPAGVPEQGVHRVLGELEPNQGARQYEAELKQHLPCSVEGWPVFDLMILGMGDDGHTASIFPHQMEWLTSKRWCEVAEHPVSGQRRVTLTGPVIRAAKETCFLITGDNKASVLRQIVHQEDDYRRYPTSHFVEAETVTLWIDKAAASGLPDHQ